MKRPWEEMAQITCVKCGNDCEVQINPNVRAMTKGGQPINPPEQIRGVFICSRCHSQTVFELTGNSVTFMPGRLFTADLSPNAPAKAVDSFQDAVFCFYGQGYRGAVGMCRSAIEDSLDAKGAQGSDLFQKIEYSKTTLGILGDEQVAEAQAARLIGRNALHRGMEVSPTQAMLALSGTIDLINYLYKP
jgi:hypothetical protein